MQTPTIDCDQHVTVDVLVLSNTDGPKAVLARCKQQELDAIQQWIDKLQDMLKSCGLYKTLT